MDCIIIIFKAVSKENATIVKDILLVDIMLNRNQMKKKSIDSAVKALLFTENTKYINFEFYGLLMLLSLIFTVCAERIQSSR